MSLQINELRKVIEKKIHIDEFRSKMGDDDDVIVFSFKVQYYDPAIELTSFLEKGYEWILDADVSSGEMEDGSYLVFVETLRRPSFPKHLINLLKDMEGITTNKTSEYTYVYHGGSDYVPITIESLEQNVPLTPREYRKAKGENPDVPETTETVKADNDKKALESLQLAAGITPKYKPVTPEDRELFDFVNLSKR